MEAALCATSEVHAKRVQWHAGVLAQPWSHSLEEEKLYSTSYNRYINYLPCVLLVPMDPKCPEPSADVRDV